MTKTDSSSSFPPDIASLTLGQWRFRWLLSRRETAQALGLTEAWIKRFDSCLLSNPTIEGTGLAALEQEFCWEASRWGDQPGLDERGVREFAAHVVLCRRSHEATDHA